MSTCFRWQIGPYDGINVPITRPRFHNRLRLGDATLTTNPMCNPFLTVVRLDALTISEVFARYRE